MDKKTLKKAREDFALHTALLLRAGHSKPIAQAIAYAEGPDALAQRLGEQGLLPVMGVQPASGPATDIASAPAASDPKIKAA